MTEKDKQYAKNLMEDIYNDISSDEDEEEPDITQMATPSPQKENPVAPESIETPGEQK